MGRKKRARAWFYVVASLVANEYSLISGISTGSKSENFSFPEFWSTYALYYTFFKLCSSFIIYLGEKFLSFAWNTLQTWLISSLLTSSSEIYIYGGANSMWITWPFCFCSAITQVRRTVNKSHFLTILAVGKRSSLSDFDLCKLFCK